MQLKLRVKFFCASDSVLRLLLFLHLLQCIRTLESESIVSSSPNNYHHSRSLYRRFSLATKAEEDSGSMENHVKQHRHSNAIMKVGEKNRGNPSNHQFNFVRSSNHTSTTPKSQAHGCSKCASSQQIDNAEGTLRTHLPENVMTQMRLELIKQQILKKLRMKEPPKSHSKPQDLPVPVALGETLHKTVHGDKNGDRDMEDFYGKTEQIIVLPEDSIANCVTFETQDPSSCFQFKLPKEIRYQEIESVELWVFKLPDPNDHKRNHTFYVNHIATGSSEGSNEDDKFSSRLIDIKSNISQSQGWLSMNITTDASFWLRNFKFKQALQIGCSSCERFQGNTDLGSPVGINGEERPFIVFSMTGMEKKKRSRRQINCGPGVNECCRERLTVNFDEIGWSWILGPKMFQTYFCKGSCVTRNGITANENTRTSIVQSVLSLNYTHEIVPCCGPTKLSSIQLIYLDTSRNSSEPVAKVETLPNMVIESCGCL